MTKRLSGVVHGDLHLEKFNAWFPKEIAPDPLGMQLSSIVSAAELARKRKTANVFLTGDIFDTAAPKQDSIARLLQTLAEQPDIKFYLYLGNHDMSSKMKHALVISEFITKSKIIPNVFTFTEPTMTKIDGFPVLVMPYGSFYEPDAPYLGFGHHTLSGAITENGIEMEGHKIRNAKSQWIMGHIHLAQSTTRAVYPGTAYQIDFGEKLPKYLMYFEAKMVVGKVHLEHELVRVKPPFKLKNVTIEKMEDFEKVEPYKNKKGPPTFYKLKIVKGILPPPKYNLARPHIIKSEPIKPDGTVLTVANVKEAPKDIKRFTPTHGLVKYLMEKKGLSKERAKIAKALVKELQS